MANQKFGFFVLSGVRRVLRCLIVERYSDYLTLRAALKSSLPHLQIPKLPKKGVSPTSLVEDINQRGEELDVFLKEIVKNTSYQCAEMLEFLGFTDRNK